MYISWNIKRFIWKVRSFLDKHMGIPMNFKKYNGKHILTAEETNTYLKEKLLKGEKLAAGRIGGNELGALVVRQKEERGKEQTHDKYSLLYLLAGYFDPEDTMDRFAETLGKAIGSFDLISVWFNQMEDVMLKRYGRRDVSYGRLEGLEPWYHRDDPWSAALKGKKVLVIHPYAKSIEKQYRENRDRLFSGTDILPKFELQTIKAVQTIYQTEDERFKSWYDALEHMYEEAMGRDLDVALIACGAYGMPLAAKLADSGRNVIHMGGALQLLFGIRGKRWDDMEELKGFYNDAWVRPGDDEKIDPEKEKNVEHGCYW